MDHTIYADWQERVRYGDEKPTPQILADDGKIRVILGGLRAGQHIPVHPEAEAVYVFLEGNGQMTVDDETFPVAPGKTVIVPLNAKRGMQAETQLAFIAVRVS